MNRTEKEIEFGLLFGPENTGRWWASSNEVDAKEHWDIAVPEDIFEEEIRKLRPTAMAGDNELELLKRPKIINSLHDPVLIDVKAHPKGDINFRWVELKNVHGDTGSLYGLAEYISFEHFNHWILTPTRLLRNMVEEKLTAEDWNRDDRQPYRRHTRDDRSDLVTQVPLKDLCWIGTIIQKP